MAPQNKSFVDWYQISTVKPSPEMLPKRWAAVEALAKVESRSQLLDMVRLVRGNAPTDAPIRNTIADTARKGDPTFSLRDNEAELRLLAGAAIVEILKTSAHKADLVAVAMITAAFQSGDGDALLNEFIAYARQYLGNEAVSIRATTVYSYLDDKETADALIAAFKLAHGDPANATKDLIAALAKPIDATTRALTRELDALREESNMFWWVFSGRSRDLNKTFRELGAMATSMLAAKELSDLTTLHPGPRSANGLLHRVLHDAGDEGAPRKISEVINATDRAWRKTWTSEYPVSAVPSATPLLVAASKSLETDNPSDWISLFVKATGVDDIALPLSTLAMQVYLECVLASVSKSVKG